MDIVHREMCIEGVDSFGALGPRNGRHLIASIECTTAVSSIVALLERSGLNNQEAVTNCGYIIFVAVWQCQNS